jgi:hypothetical protein
MDNRQDDKKPNTPQFLSREGENQVLHNLDIRTQVDHIANNDHLVTADTIDSLDMPAQPPHSINLAELHKKGGTHINQQSVYELINSAKGNFSDTIQNGSINSSSYLKDAIPSTPSFNISQTPAQSHPSTNYFPPVHPTPISTATEPIAPTQTKIIYKEKHKGCLGGMISFVFKSVGCLLFILGLITILFVYIINF